MASFKGMGRKSSRWVSMAKEASAKVGRVPTLVTESKQTSSASAGSDLHSADVNAGGGCDAVVFGEVDGGNGEPAADAASTCRGAEDREGPAQQPARAPQVACGDELADAAAGDIHTVHPKWLVDVDGKAELRAESGQFMDAGPCAKAEAEVVAFVDLDSTQPFEQHALDKAFGALLRELGGKGKNHRGVDAGGGEQIEALAEAGSDEAWSGAGAQEVAGMRFEGDGDREGVECASPLHYACQQEAVAEMETIVVADA